MKFLLGSRASFSAKTRTLAGLVSETLEHAGTVPRRLGSPAGESRGLCRQVSHRLSLIGKGESPGSAGPFPALTDLLDVVTGRAEPLVSENREVPHR
jgi:hypothetical protein